MQEANRCSRGPSRRTLLRTGAGLLAAPAIMRVAKAQTRGGFDWQRFRGQSLEVSLTLGPRADLLRRHQKEFEELTGIKVGSESVPEQQH
ncbi:MAG: hypothetical protein FJX57_07200, partial [Alphaproteobacteria bacterium]|nr:hypothetical protein [Alphaproteobacteria bacterium]